MDKRTSPLGIFSVKAHWEQLNWFNRRFPKTLDKLHLQNYIYIKRKDLLEQAISSEIAFQTKSYISMKQSGDIEPEYSRQRIDKYLVQIKTKNNAWDSYFINKKIEPFRINYEDLVADPSQQLFRICQYMSLNISSIESNELIRNYNTQSEHSPQKQSTALNSLWKQKYNDGI